MILWKGLLAGVATATALGTGFGLATLGTDVPKQPDIVQVGVTAGGQSTEAMRPWWQPVMQSQDTEGTSTAAAFSSRTDSRDARGGDDSPDDVRDGLDGHDDHDDASDDEAHHDDHGVDQEDHEDDDHGDDGGDD